MYDSVRQTFLQEHCGKLSLQSRVQTAASAVQPRLLWHDHGSTIHRIVLNGD